MEVGLDAAWEMDIFGGVRRDVEAADSDIKAAVEDQRNVLVTLAARLRLTISNFAAFSRKL